MKKLIKKLVGYSYWNDRTVEERLAELHKNQIYLEKRMDWAVKRISKVEKRL